MRAPRITRAAAHAIWSTIEPTAYAYCLWRDRAGKVIIEHVTRGLLVELPPHMPGVIGYVENGGGHAIGATVLTGKPYSAKLAPDDDLIRALRDKHGRELENWWREKFGFGFDCLTRSEARYLEKSADAQVIRDRITEAGLKGGPGTP